MIKIFAEYLKHPFVRRAIVTTPLFRNLAWRFVAGENLAAGLATVRVLNERGIKGTLNYVGTHILDEAEARAAADEVIRALEAIAAQRLDSNLSLKLTQIGLDIDISLCREHLHRILEYACRLGNFIRIDMEELSYGGKNFTML